MLQTAQLARQGEDSALDLPGQCPSYCSMLDAKPRLRVPKESSNSVWQGSVQILHNANEEEVRDEKRSHLLHAYKRTSQFLQAVNPEEANQQGFPMTQRNISLPQGTHTGTGSEGLAGRLDSWVKPCQLTRTQGRGISRAVA